MLKTGSLKKEVREMAGIPETRKVELLSDRLVWDLVKSSEDPQKRINIMLDLVRLPQEVLSLKSKAAIFLIILAHFSLGRWMEEWEVLKRTPVWKMITLPKPEMDYIHNLILDVIEEISRRSSGKEKGEKITEEDLDLLVKSDDEVDIEVLSEFLAKNYTDEEKAKFLAVFIDAMYCGSEVLEDPNELNNSIEKLLKSNTFFDDEDDNENKPQ